MKIVHQVSWRYTLYEDDDGSYVLELVVPAPNGAWASYEKQVKLSGYEKFLIKTFPGRLDYLARKLLDDEKK